MSAAAAPVRVLPFGDAAVLVEVAGLDEVLALHRRLGAAAPPGVVDLVPAARTVLVRLDPVLLPPSRARAWIAAATETPVPPAASAAEVVLPIVYDGADLAEAAALVGLKPAELAAAHTAASWTVAFTGFAPGFGYLVSPDWPFEVPRRPTPRTRVPAGAVGLAGGFSGAYPRESPGGWQLIGTTSALLFDPTGQATAPLAPGVRVRFDPAAPAPPPRRPGPAPDARHAPGFVVLEPGLQTTVQDAGRPGRAAEGVAPAGAVDAAARATANRLLGNAPEAAVLEVTLGGFRAVAERDLDVVVTGAWGPIRLAGRPVDPYVVHVWPAGAELALDWFAHGTRAYLGVRGGIAATAFGGSRSTDTMSRLGPDPLTAGAHVAVGAEVVGPPPALPLHPWGPPADDRLELPVVVGPRDDWFAPDARARFLSAEWVVSAQADRVGIRLEGPPLERIVRGELPSEGMVPGAVQVPPGGGAGGGAGDDPGAGPVVLGVDGPVTGGYPVIAVVTAVGLRALAQARPGTRIRFRAVAAS